MRFYCHKEHGDHFRVSVTYGLQIYRDYIDSEKNLTIYMISLNR